MFRWYWPDFPSTNRPPASRTGRYSSWIKADLRVPRNPYAWQNWKAKIKFPMQGYYEVWARATDNHGKMQPFAIAWNPKGYLNNSMHRVAIRVV